MVEHTYIIKLNVGGEKFYTTYGTLKQSAYFRTLIDEQHINEDTVYVNGDEIFFDRSSYHFKFIMQFLRDSQVHFEQNKDLLGLIEEAEFYSLHKLVDQIRTHRLKQTEKGIKYKLVSPEELEQISGAYGENDTQIRALKSKYRLISVIKRNKTKLTRNFVCMFHYSGRGSPNPCCTKSKAAHVSTLNNDAKIQLLVAIE